jgi:hypothetical protein
MEDDFKMNDPLTMGFASTAVGLVNSTISLLKEAKQAAKSSEDHELKDKLNEVFDSFLDLKEVIGNLRDENADLRSKLNARDSLRWDTETKLYYAEGDIDPFCPACFDNGNKQIRLTPEFARGARGANVKPWKYDCKTCKNIFVLRD